MSKVDDDWQEIHKLLRRAAQIATAHSSGSKEFVLAAWEAFLACNPRMREQVEREEMRSEFEAARKLGKLAQA
ncbi:MAG TPA: hypothetical protein VL326_17245 [Kofleriaceae bacterium]|jgi:hypothetical protein|nr:hypothetical protein [Kofleriaceae bacterium]